MEPDDKPNRISDYDILLLKNDELKLEVADLRVELAQHEHGAAHRAHMDLANTLAKRYNLDSGDRIDVSTGMIIRAK